jgi:4-hydroxybenzoate polyprenyltransferase
MVKSLFALSLLPKRWLINIIQIQEKKNYNFYVIIIFAMFVGLIRFLLEVMVANRPLFHINLNVIHMFTFYLHCIFIYTLILKLMVPGLDWRKSIHLVLIGAFLGILPPIIDSFYYGIGNFKYGYVDNFQENWRLFLYNPEAHVPLGEAVVLYLTIFFTAVVVFIKTSSFTRTLITILFCYAFIFFYAALLPSLAFGFAEYMRLILNQNMVHFNEVSQKNFMGFTGIFFVSMFQATTCLIIYLILNPTIFKNLMKRINHAVPVALTCLLGYVLFKPLDIYALFMALVLVLASFVVIVQNDYFDEEEDRHDGRENYVNLNDVRFFNGILITFIALFAASASLVAYTLLLFLIVSVIYNYDFYRGKKYFPANYKIEGIWGLSAFLCGLAMVINTSYLMMGDALNVVGMGMTEDIMLLHQTMMSEIWTTETLLMAFLVFGGWSIISVIKDYKDIESDLFVGNQTLYSLILKNGRSIKGFHKKYVIFLCVMMLTPIIWFMSLQISSLFILLLIALVFAFYFSIMRQASNRVVEQSLVLINIYIFNLVLAAHFNEMAQLS